MTQDGDDANSGADADAVAETDADAQSKDDSTEIPTEPLTEPPETDGEHEGKTFTARVRSVERVRAREVPEDYPVAIETADALDVRLTVDGTEKPIFRLYFETADRGPDDRFAHLLELAGTPDSDPESLEGQSLLLTIRDGFYMPVVPDEQRRGNPYGVYGVFAGLAPSIIIALVGIFSPGAAFIASTPFVAGWLLAMFVLLPLSLYADAWHLRTTTGWSGDPRKWAAMAMVPGLNVLVVPLYLITRENAESVV